MSRYVVGNGCTSISAGMVNDIEIPFIKISKIESGKKIGESLLGSDVEEAEITTIMFKNLEGLAVLEKAVKNVKKRLKEQKERTGL